uniref:CwfJ C-terminus 1-like protein, putative n=1 Tax=Babesia bovis TaxID=5865 RepID=S6BLX6_BABBO|nr:CwfJ C-terminus 1-like protein, putative [Babesia bovis]
MVAFVSEESYIAIAKGPLHPLHSLVTPIYHYPNAACAPTNVLKDIQRMLDCLFDLCLKNGMGAIAFERYMPMHNPNAMHTQIQVVPVSLDRAMDAFGFVNGSEHFAGSRVEVLSDEFPTSIESLQGRLDSIQRSYFYLQVLGKKPGGTGFVHSHCLWTLGHRGGGRRIPITFGRELVLYLLPDTAWDSVPCSKLGGHSIASSWKQYAIDWRNCVTNKDSETTLSQNLSKSLITLDTK